MDRGPSQPYLAVLEAKESFTERINLVRVGKKPNTQRHGPSYKFQPLIYYAGRGLVLGIIEPTRDAHLQLEQHLVRPAPDVSAEPLLLQIISPAPRTLTAWPRVRREGVLKAIERAVDDASQDAEPGLANWWLACQLALRGFVTREEWKDCCHRTAGRHVEPGSLVEPAGPHLVWYEYLELELEKLRTKALSEERNPLQSELTPTVASRALGGLPVEICSRLLELLAKRDGLPLDYWQGEPIIKLAGKPESTGSSPDDAEVIKDVMKAFAIGQGAVRDVLERRYPGHRHVIRWLFEAQWLVETADGYVFTRQQLERLLIKVLDWDIPPAQIGVGTLKQRLGLARRRAEALRSYLVEKYGDDAGPLDPAEAEDD